MKLKTWWFMTSTTYTCLIPFFALFRLFDVTSVPTFNATSLLQIFVLVAVLSLAQLLWGWLDVTSRICRRPRWQVPVDALCRCLICIVLVLGLGIPIGLVPAVRESLSLVLPIIIPVFLVVYTITYLSFRHTQKDADFINDKIKAHRDADK